MYKLITFLLVFLLSITVEAQKGIPLKPELRLSVSYQDTKKVAQLKKKAQNAKPWKSKGAKKRIEYYIQAAQLGDYESQVIVGYYYGFGTFYPYDVDFDEEKMQPTYDVREENESIARHYLNAAYLNKDERFKDQASLGLVYLSLDSINNPIVSISANIKLLIGCFWEFDEYRNDNLTYEHEEALKNVCKFLAKMYSGGFGPERDLIKAHYYAFLLNKTINMPNNPYKYQNNEYTERIIKQINSLSFNEESKNYGVGLVSALLLKRAVDLYKIRKTNPEIIFWLERSLEADSTNAKAYYLAGCLYLNGDASLRKNRVEAKEWLKKGSNLGSNESTAALAALEEIEEAEEAERERDRTRRREEAERRRQQRRRMWAQAIGAIIQTAGNAYLASQGYASANNGNLLNPNLAVQQVQAQYAQMAYLQQISMQSIQLPQFDFNWTKPPQFTIDWSNVDWSSASMNNYYIYQGDLLSNESTAVGNNESYSSSFSSTGISDLRSCYLCHGTGKCWTCNGSRTFLNPLTGKNVACPNCTDGLCSHCHGSRKK